MKEVNEVTDETTGTWNVQTETSSYILDMDEHKAMRMPNTGAGIHPDHAKNRTIIVTDLRNDGKWFTFARLVQCKVGDIMFMRETLDGECRASTIIRKITKVVAND